MAKVKAKIKNKNIVRREMKKGHYRSAKMLGTTFHVTPHG